MQQVILLHCTAVDLPWTGRGQRVRTSGAGDSGQSVGRPTYRIWIGGEGVTYPDYWEFLL